MKGKKQVSKRKKSLVSRSSGSSKASVKNSKVNLSKDVDLGTFDRWLAHQKEYSHEKGNFRSFTEGVMISNTTEDWLSKQSVTERPQKEELPPPVDTMEEWLRKQVSQKLAVEEKEAEPLTPQQS